VVAAAGGKDTEEEAVLKAVEASPRKRLGVAEDFAVEAAHIQKAVPAEEDDSKLEERPTAVLKEPEGAVPSEMLV
jgi:hypothetical protein